MTTKLNSIDDVIASMETRFQPEKSKGVVSRYQWKIKGDRGRDFCVFVNDGEYEIIQGEVDKPNVTFETDDETYLRLVNNEIKGMTAILTRKLLVKGNIYLASKMDNIFK
ncbi:SCP2 sterol-binding domain-containing protein [Enterovibrio sp. 27052020O]|uniref:SCP2 sterol-binding domain-containing protein n=1 Tax=Enterovibrio sp. 27052020O TaxID=3241166 RepID=UPI00388D695E